MTLPYSPPNTQLFTCGKEERREEERGRNGEVALSRGAFGGEVARQRQ